MRQAANVASDVFVREAWAKGAKLCVHGWVYSLANGLITDLDITMAGPQDVEAVRSGRARSTT
jgi:carbonic anhydrase